MLINKDCIEALKEMADNSVDSICTDPPYELGFMGKNWDNTGIANNKEMWKECLRVLKPGGHLLAFSGTRTYHRMASAIEDAGFEVRDMIEWVYGSGFPKSHNIGKNIEKIKVGGIKNLKQIGTKKGIKVETGTQGFSYSKEYVAGKSMGGKQISGDIPVYEINNEWEGWGTALKPAHEPICMARKPLSEKTVAENCLKWGTGGINIDESRVEIPENDKENYEFNNNGLSRMSRPEGEKLGQFDGGWKIDKTKRETPTGRFPANLILGADENGVHEEVRECFPDTKSSKGSFKADDYEERETATNFTRGDFNGRGDSGNASRFFKSILYYPKASKSERNKGCEGLEEKQKAGAEFRPNHQEKANNGESGNAFGRWNKVANNHPTVKPIALMEYLIKMVTPKGGIVLDPFMGSGSTGVACIQNGFDFIGIDMTPEYIEIAKARIEHAEKEIKSRLL
jgi:DNA modification methylase